MFIAVLKTLDLHDCAYLAKSSFNSIGFFICLQNSFVTFRLRFQDGGCFNHPVKIVFSNVKSSCLLIIKKVGI